MKTAFQVERDARMVIDESISYITEDKLEKIPDNLQTKKEEIIHEFTALLLDYQQVAKNGEDIQYVS